MKNSRAPQPPPRPAWQAISRSDSSAVAMRSVAAALRGEFVSPWEITANQRRLLSWLARGGKRLSTTVIERVIAASAVPPSWAEQITTDDLASWAVSLYAGLRGPWEAIIVGAPNGGVAHLAMALGVPFLSQHFVTAYRDPTPADDVVTYQEHGAALAQAILGRNKDLAIINHYDPLHDRFLIKHVNHIRYKLMTLPKAYQSFIERNLRPGGTIIFSDCRYPWLMYLMGERHWFQVGGLGAVTAQEYLEGRPEIAALQQRGGQSGPGHWGLPGRRPFAWPESEWGALPPFREEIEQYARANAYRFVGLDGAHPEAFSLLAFHVWKRLLAQEGIEPQGVLVETFTQVAPLAPRRSALLPLWLPWNCTDSLAFLQRSRAFFPPDRPVLWLPLPNFVETFDTVLWQGWLTALEGLEVQALGMNPRLYPADPTALFTVGDALRAWVEAHPRPVTGVLTADAVLEEALALRNRH